MISDSFAGLRGVSLGETIALPTPRGILRLPIAGITRDFSDDEGTILLDRSVFRQWWNDDKANIVRIYLRPRADQAAVETRDRRRASLAGSACSSSPMRTCGNTSSGSPMSGSG